MRLVGEVAVHIGVTSQEAADVFGGWCDSKTMFAIHKGSANKVAHDETCT